jgi:hypothetical protein
MQEPLLKKTFRFILPSRWIAASHQTNDLTWRCGLISRIENRSGSLNRLNFTAGFHTCFESMLPPPPCPPCLRESHSFPDSPPIAIHSPKKKRGRVAIRESTPSPFPVRNQVTCQTCQPHLFRLPVWAVRTEMRHRQLPAQSSTPVPQAAPHRTRS